MTIQLAIQLIGLAICFHGFDIITGLANAWKQGLETKTKVITSSKLRDGLFKKMGFIFSYMLCIGIKFASNFIDLGIVQELFIPVVAYSIFTEIVSITENIKGLNPDMGTKLKNLVKNNGGYINLQFFAENILHGIDISHWQNSNVIEQAKDFVIIKSSEGINYIDGHFIQHIQTALESGKLIGIYHYARPENNSAQDEVNSFLSIIKDYIGQAILILDWEGNALDCSPEWALEWLQLVEEQTNIKPFIYMSTSQAKNEKYHDIAYAGFPLWQPDYENELDDTIWGDNVPLRQYSNSAGQLDLDVFFGDCDLWKQYCTKQVNLFPEDSPSQPSADHDSDTQPCDDMNCAEQNDNSQSCTVQAGEGFWSVAQRVWGDGNRWRELADINGLAYDHILYTGDVLQLGTDTPEIETPVVEDEINVGDWCKVTSQTDYAGIVNDKWVLQAEFIILSIVGDRVVVGNTDSEITGAWHKIDIQKV